MMQTTMQTNQNFFDATQLFENMIDLTTQMQTASVDAMMSNWEGGLDFFANLLKRTEEIAMRNNTLFLSVVE